METFHHVNLIPDILKQINKSSDKLFSESHTLEPCACWRGEPSNQPGAAQEQTNTEMQIKKKKVIK